MNYNYENFFKHFEKYSLRKKIKTIKRFFKTLDTSCDLIISKELPIFVNGYFDKINQKIILNKELLSNGPKIYEVIFHELYHKKQFDIVKGKQHGWEKYHIFINENISIKGYTNNSLYIRISNKFNDIITDKLLIFNQLSLYEREAYIEGYINVIKINERYLFPLTESIDYFKFLYCDCSKKEIFKLIDDCFYKVYDNKEPSNNLEATIMYDICIISLFQAENISEVQFLEYMNDKNKERILEENNYEIYSDLDEFIPSNSLDYLCMGVREKDYILKEINKLNEIQIKNNPKLMTLAKHYYPDEVEKILEAKKINYNNIESEKELC